VLSPLMFLSITLLNSKQVGNTSIQLALGQEYSFDCCFSRPPQLPCCLIETPIPLNLYLGATLRFLQSSLCIPYWIQLLQPSSFSQWVALTPVCCPTALPTWLRCCSAAVLLLVSTKSLWLRDPASTVPFPQLVQQKSCMNNCLRCKPCQHEFFRYILMSHVSLSMQQQLLCHWQYCHQQCALLTCMCFREDKESTCCWPWQVPSVLVDLDAQSYHVIQFTFRPLNECRWEVEDSHTFACEQFRC